MAAWTRAFVLTARAKLNLALTVGAVQRNRLHEIRSFAGSLSLADDLWFEPHEGVFTVACEGVDVPEGDNLAFLAAAALGDEARGVRIRIDKRIPAQAGLGGGSADAAAALLGLVRIARERGAQEYSTADVRMAAASLGSDVPACLISGFKSMAGTGEIVHAYVAAPPPWGVALLKPAVSVSTAIAYRLFDERDPGLQGLSEPIDVRDESETLAACVRSGTYLEFCERVHNDFDPIIRHAFPEVARAHVRLRTAGADATILCGSGSAVAGFFQTVAEAEAAISRIDLAPGEWMTAAGFAGAG